MARRRRRRREAWLFAEYVVLFVGAPLAYVSDLIPLPPIPALWILSGACLAILLGARDFDRRRLWNARRLRVRLLRALLPFLFAAPLLFVMTATVAPEKLFGMIRERPVLWGTLMVLYPVLSVYPQGLVYRAFIFHRYRPLFRNRWMRIVASALAFSMVHVIFENWIAPLLTLAGGLLFAWTYARTRSALVASFQHALFGCFSFTIGLGWFFYYAAVVGG
ncbi:MAG: CPBP family intramembrane glutamic endopeptidase [Acidobacteriota bacterium]|nr:CPBP family intramembrane glutamic endopeptidase [Acidobacteriota bacterium]